MPIVIKRSIPVVVRPVPQLVVKVQPAALITVVPSEAVIVIPSRVAVVTVRPTAAVIIEPHPAETVRPPDRGAWDERGWTRRHDGDKQIFEGFYQVGGQRFRGRIEIGRRGRVQAFINNPPREIRRHRHHACFQQYGAGTGWYILHWQRSPRNVDEALLYFEQILDESINNR